MVVIVGNRPLVVAGYGTFIDDMIKLAGGKNIASCSRVSYPQYSLEKILQVDPDVIIIAKGIVKDKKEIYNDSQWQSLSAVKHEQVLMIDENVISRPGPRVIDAVEMIAKFLHRIEL